MISTNARSQLKNPVASGLQRETMGRRAWWPVAMAVAPGVALLCLTVGRIPGMMWDSVEYCAAATAFASRGTLTTPMATSFDGQFDAAGHLVTPHPFVLWAPGYPLVLGTIARVLGIDVKFAAVLIGAAALLVTLLCVWAIVARATDVSTAAAATALLGVLPAVQLPFRRALSEPLFLACCAVMVLALTRWLDDSPPRTRWSWTAATAAGLAVNVRFTGVLLVALHAMCAMWWLSHRRHTRAQRFTLLLSVLTGPAIGSLFLLYRLRTLGCLLCESRGGSTQGFVTNVRSVGEAMVLWLPAVYDLLPGPLDTALSLAFLLALFAWNRARFSSVRRSGASEGPHYIVLAFAAWYAAGMIVIRTFVEFDYLDVRLLAPVGLALVGLALAAAFHQVEPRARVRVAAVAVLVFAAAGAVSSTLHPWRVLSDPSDRYTPFVRYAEDVLERRSGVAIFSDEASLLVSQLGFERPVYWMPTHGVPALRPGEQGVVLLRRSPVRDRMKEIAALDAVAQRLPGPDDVLAWELR